MTGVELAEVLREPPRHVLPERIRRRIAEQEVASEILVGWVQLAVVVTFGVLYLLAPKTFSSEAMIEPVPWALGCYLLFTVTRLVTARRRALPGWFRAMSVIVDVALLLLLIWSFHIQYEQPPAFVLKSPTLLYVFIFIALRALLFDARYVILTGLTAAGGWLMMVAYVVLTDTRPDLVTRDYVHYLTSNSLLLGAEFDKIVVILFVTGIIAAAMARARRLLVTAVAESVHVHDLSRFFAPEVAERITAAETEITPGRGESRDAAILYVDIRDFTTMASHLPPDALIRFLTRFQAHLMPPILTNNGTAEKYLGDGLMAAFGAAVPRRTHAADALRAADGIIAEIDAWNRERAAAGESEIRIGIAIAAGKIVFGAVGGEARLEYAVVGHPVNFAAKLEKHNKVEGTRGLCTAEAYDLALAQGYAGDPAHARLRARTIAGVGEPVDLVVLAR